MTDIPDTVKRQAAQWWVDLQEPDAPPALRQAWRTWVDAHPDHALAWRKVEALAGKVSLLPGGGVAGAALLPARPMRRRVLGLAATGVVGLAAWQLTDGLRHPGRLQTVAGQRRDMHLADGSHLILNTRTAVDVRFDAEQRLLVLDRGELWLSSGVDPQSPARPLRVRTSAGLMQAVGTRFLVRHDDTTWLHVLDGAVDVWPAARIDGPATRVPAAHGLRFGPGWRDTVRAAPSADVATAWTRGMLLASDMPLSEFIAELARYRAGFLRCDPALAHLRVSGTFPLEDTDRILQMLQRELPLRVVWRTRYWVTLLPRESA